jgi:hypothetical protein
MAWALAGAQAKAASIKPMIKTFLIGVFYQEGATLDPNLPRQACQGISTPGGILSAGRSSPLSPPGKTWYYLVS